MSRTDRPTDATVGSSPADGGRGTARKPIWEVLADITRTAPEEELRKLPVDGSIEHDHYIYGTPKKNQ